MPQTEKVVRELKAKGKYWVSYANYDLEILPDVFYYFDSEFIAENIKIPKDSKVLDMGTGSGLLAIVASKKAKEVVAADISAKAVKCAFNNIERLGLQNKIKVLKSDLFENIKGKFDIIIFNIPFNPTKKPKNYLEMAVFDKDGTILKKFFSSVKKFLSPTGFIYFAYASFGRMDILESELKRLNLSKKIVKSLSKNNDTFYLFKITKEH